MNKSHRPSLLAPLTTQRGAVSIAAALSMTALLGAGAMAVDVGNVMVARNDIQDAVDAGALRGAEMLYASGATSPNFSMMTNSSGSPVYVAINQNDTIGSHDTLTVNSNYWQSINPNAPSNEAAVRVSLTKQVHLFFGGILGMNDMNVSATATAIVQNASALGAGGTKLPIAIPQCAINQYWDSHDHQPKSDPIQVGPTHTCSGGSDNSNPEHQDNQNQSDHQQSNQDNQNQSDHQQSNHDSLNESGLPHRAGITVLDVRPHLVRSDFSSSSGQWESALSRFGQSGRFMRIDHQQNSGADRNGSANQTQGTGEGAGGPGNGNGPGNGAGQGLGSDGNNSSSSSSNSCVTGQFTTLTSHPDNSNFDRAESVTKDGNPEDIHTGDSISLESSDYTPPGNSNNNSNNNSNSSQGEGSQGNHSDQQRQQHHSRLESSYAILRATLVLRNESASPIGYLRVDSHHNGDGNNQNQGDGNNQSQGDGQQGSGDPYTSINNCSAAGNHSCEYSIVPVVNNATSNGNGAQTIVGFACLHVLSATDGTINATLSSGCVSNTTTTASTSNLSSQTAWGVVSPPRLAR